ncbi:MAG: hypothetical protein ACOVLC_11405 [Flavobacterium sp.]
MGGEKPSNIQVELIKLYQYPIDENQLMDIKKWLGNYFAKMATTKMDAIWEKNNWSKEAMDQWLTEHDNDSRFKFHF